MTVKFYRVVGKVTVIPDGSTVLLEEGGHIHEIEFGPTRDKEISIDGSDSYWTCYECKNPYPKETCFQHHKGALCRYCYQKLAKDNKL